MVYLRDLVVSSRLNTRVSGVISPDTITPKIRSCPSFQSRIELLWIFPVPIVMWDIPFVKLKNEQPHIEDVIAYAVCNESSFNI